MILRRDVQKKGGKACRQGNKGGEKEKDCPEKNRGGGANLEKKKIGEGLAREAKKP